MERIDVLDHGYVILHETMGDDLTVSNSARVSFNKKKEKLSSGDIKLINFLAEYDHTSPFRHATMQFEVYAPLMVARQWWKYVVGSDHVMDSWNESSRRYVTEEPVFYIPKDNEWRSAPENKKQGSGEPLTEDQGAWFTKELIEYAKRGEQIYNIAQRYNIATEQARLFLPAYGMYVRWYWTTSLQAVGHFLEQRMAHDAQKEIQLYAQAVYDLSIEKFPIAIKALLEERTVSKKLVSEALKELLGLELTEEVQNKIAEIAQKLGV